MLEVQRFLFLIFPYVLCTTLAALILWGEDWRSYAKPLLLYSIVAGTTQTLSYQIQYEAIRFPLEIISGFLLTWVIFRKSFTWVTKIFTASYVIGVPLALLSFTISSVFIGSTPQEMHLNSNREWLIINLPVLTLGLLATGLIRKLFTVKKYNIPYYDNIQGWSMVAAALLLQMAVSIGLIVSLATLKGDHSWYIAICAGSFTIFMISLFIMGTYIKAMQRKTVISTQDAVSENIMELLKTFKAQQHDFLNHLQVISGLCQMQNLNELREYLKGLMKETRTMDKTLGIGNPILAALINAKIALAEARGIMLHLDIESDFLGINYAAADLSRILGNLINNAMDAIESRETGKEVRLKIRDQGSSFICWVENPWTGELPPRRVLFSPGFSTKQGEHSGLGLYICRQLTHRLHGELDYRFSPEEGQVSFILSIPRIMEVQVMEQQAALS